MRTLCGLVICLSVMLAAASGPVEFGRSEFDRAAAEKKLRPATARIQTEVSEDRPETFRIIVGRVSGGDVRGLMYGLLEAADQIRTRGRLVATKGSPALPIRALRLVIRPEDTRKDWYTSPEYWPELFATLACSRINRLTLVFSGQRGAPSDLETLAFISRAAAAYAVELSLGLRAEDLFAASDPASDDAGPASLSALKSMLAACGSVRSVQIWTDEANGRKLVAFYRDWLFRAVREAGRRVTLELRQADLTPELLEAAKDAGPPLRIAADYPNGKDTADTAGYEKLCRLEATGPSASRAWTDPAYVRRTMSEFPLAGCGGFEIEAPAPPGGQADRLFYLLWGRLGYDPRTPDSVWNKELKPQ